MSLLTTPYKRIISTTQGQRLLTYMTWGEGFVVRPAKNGTADEYVIECRYSYDTSLVDKLVSIFDGK